MLGRTDIEDILGGYDRLKLRIGMTASHSALDICDGAIEEGFPTAAYAKQGRHLTYERYFAAKTSSSFSESVNSGSSSSRGTVE